MHATRQPLVTLVGLVAARGRANVVVNNHKQQQQVLLAHYTEKDLYQVRNEYADLVLIYFF